MTPEGEAQNRVRLAASKLGARLWRNNVGAGKLDNGSFIRWGLANDSSAMNETLKSGDLIGIRPVLITAEHIGCIFGQFVSREVKRPGWRYCGTDRERAQKAWIDLVRSLGGDADFTTGEF
jgi:hypothetical protein